MSPGRLRAPSLLILTICTMLGLWSSATHAQDTPGGAVHSTDDGNRILYRLRFFDLEGVISLEQLLDQIPDLQHALDDSMRGSEYVVLVNTHVVGTAPRDLRDIGRRFKLEDIKRIVIWRGPVALERGGITGPAINIVLKEGADLSVGRWEVNTPLLNTRYKAPNIKLSYSDRNRPGDWVYEVFADYLPNARVRPRVRKEVYLDADDLQPTQERRTEYDENNGYYGLGGSASWRPSERVDLRLNSRVAENRKDRLQERWIDDEAVPDITDLEDDRRMYEVGLTGVFQYTPTSIWETRLQLIDERRDKLVMRADEPGQALAAASATRHDDQRLSFVSEYNTMAQSGSEARFSVYARSRSRDALSAVSLDPVKLGAEAEINEDRFGVVAGYNWQSRRDIRIYSGIDIESWHLQQQNGPFSRDDQEWFVKPVVSLRWRMTPKSQLRVSSRVSIRPLNFDQMVFNFDLDDEIVDTGNLSMVPQKNWFTSVSLERRVLKQKGRLGIGGFYRQMKDHIDREPRLKGSGPGNIGDAFARGLQLTGRYEVLDNPDMLSVLKAEFILQESEVTDPFTHQDRRVRGVPDQVVRLEFRQEFPNRSLDYSFDMVWSSDTYTYDYNYREIRSFSHPRANLKANYQASDNLQLWMEVSGLFDLDESRNREKYAGDAALGMVSRYEQSVYLEDRQFAVGVQGYF